MRAFYRHFWLPFYRRWALRQMDQERRIRCEGLDLKIPPGVFHPGLFFSTPLFLSFLKGVELQGKKVLDIGTGSGLLALFSAQQGARVTALDLHPLALETARSNAAANQLPISFLQSDLLDQLPSEPYDLILINPPYYPQAPRNLAEHAFFAGENLEYFQKLFAQLPRIWRKDPDPTVLWMILSEDCDLVKIKEIASGNGFRLRIVFEKKKWGERFWIVQAEPV